jgi:glycosyltransferase involved in cell wall biosynthesis
VWNYALELARGLHDRVGLQDRYETADYFNSAPEAGLQSPQDAGVNGDSEIQILLAVMGPPPRGFQRSAAWRIPGLRLAMSSFRLEWMGSCREDVEQAGEWLLDLEQDFGPDLVHLNQYAFGQLPWTSPVLMVGHSCVVSWYHSVMGTEPPPEWDRYRSEVGRGLAGAGMVTAPTRVMLESLHDNYCVFSAAPVVYNGADPGYRSAGKKEHLIFTAGRLWDDAKNIHLLDRAAPLVNWPIWAAGTRRQPQGGKVHLPNLRCLGELDGFEMVQWLRRASIFALPARYEPFGLSALEAGLCGCALVLGDIPSLREVWEDAALYVPVDSPGETARWLNALSEDPCLLEEMGRRAGTRAREYSVRRMTQGYVSLYDRLLNGPAA